MSIRDAAQQALEALEQCGLNDERRSYEQERAAITALRVALAEGVPEANFGNMAQSVDSTEADHIPDATKMMASVREDRTVEPVAYIKGYSKGRCIIEAVDPDWLLPVGMALYRSPPTSQEFLQLEPVGYGVFEDGNLHDSFRLEHEAKLFAALKGEHAEVLALYSAPPKREPLTDEEIQECVAEVDEARLAGPITELIRAAERKLGIGGEE